MTDEADFHLWHGKTDKQIEDIRKRLSDGYSLLMNRQSYAVSKPFWSREQHEKRIELLNALEVVTRALNRVDEVLKTIAPDEPLLGSGDLPPYRNAE